MKSWLVLGLLVGAGLLALPPAGAEEGEIAGIDWMTDLDAAREQAGKEDRPLLVVFR